MFISDLGGSGVVPFHFLVSGTCELYEAWRISLATHHTHRFTDGDSSENLQLNRAELTALVPFWDHRPGAQDWSIELEDGKHCREQGWWAQEHPIPAPKGQGLGTNVSPHGTPEAERCDIICECPSGIWS